MNFKILLLFQMALARILPETAPNYEVEQFKQEFDLFTTLNFIYPSVKYDNNCRELYEPYIKSIKIPRVVVQKGDTDRELDNFMTDLETSRTWIFVNDFKSFKGIVDEFVNEKFFQNSGKYVIAICTLGVTDHTMVYAMAQELWWNQILNFRICYHDGMKIKNTLYNPFTGELHTTDFSYENSIEFPDKLRDMNNHTLNVLGKSMLT